MYSVDPKKSAMRSFLNGQIEPLNLSKSPVENRFTNTYYAFYGIDFPDIVHHIGYIPAADYTIATQAFITVQSKGTVIIVHGYFDHSAMMRQCIKVCIEMGFSVLTIDLPGHGLSSGERASIKSFSEYANVLDECITYCKSFLSGPFHFVGHSTGSSAGLEWLHTRALVNNSLIDKVVLLAPLVRNTGSVVTRVLFNILRTHIDEIYGFYKPTTSDPEFELFRKNDPLRPKRFPLKWLNAAIEWNKQMHKRGLLDRKITVIQGTRDTVVDWKYNIDFLERKVRDTEIIYVKDARHQLHNEREDLREQVMDALRMGLGD
jgi:alpha-beta hydrolase superfamily lysophospholipase